MEFLGHLGIDIKLLIAQIINFGLLLWLLKKFLYKPIIGRIEKDEKTLAQAKIQAEKLQKARNDFERQKKEEIFKTRQRSEEIIKEAEGIATEIRGRAQKETDKEKRAVMKQIRSRLEDVKYAEKTNRQTK
jgi:F-type H+-transporting ATPase subunit b